MRGLDASLPGEIEDGRSEGSLRSLYRDGSRGSGLGPTRKAAPMITPTEKPEVNLVSPENLLNPNPLYRYLRESEPVHWSQPLQSWVVTRHEDVAACFRDPRLSAART